MRALFILLFVPLLAFAQAGGPPFIPVNMMKVSETPVSNTVDAVGALITKHGILIVEFANQLHARGKTKVEAVIEAASLRLRPILMTTAAMVLGTLLTLFVIPVAYTLLTRDRKPSTNPHQALTPTPGK